MSDEDIRKLEKAEAEGDKEAADALRVALARGGRPMIRTVPNDVPWTCRIRCAKPNPSYGVEGCFALLEFGYEDIRYDEGSRHNASIAFSIVCPNCKTLLYLKNDRVPEAVLQSLRDGKKAYLI